MMSTMMKHRDTPGSRVHRRQNARRCTRMRHHHCRRAASSLSMPPPSLSMLVVIYDGSTNDAHHRLRARRGRRECTVGRMHGRSRREDRAPSSALRAHPYGWLTRQNRAVARRGGGAVRSHRRRRRRQLRRTRTDGSRRCGSATNTPENVCFSEFAILGRMPATNIK